MNVVCASMIDKDINSELSRIFVDGFYQWLKFFSKDKHKLANKVHECLSIGGDFVFSVEHPIFTAHGTQDWFYDHENNRQHWPVDKYFIEGKRTALFLGEQIIKYHKTLTTYVSNLLINGFIITGLVEPQPAEKLLHSVPDMKDELRRPMMLIVSAKRS